MKLKSPFDESKYDQGRTTILDPSDVRDIASRIKGCSEIQNKSARKGRWSSSSSTTNIVSFILEDKDQELVKINVYCETGTVGTCRVLNDEVRETFRRNCSLDKVKQIIRNPPSLAGTDMDSHLNQVIKAKDSNQSDIVNSLKQNLELTEVGVATLTEEVETLEKHLQILEEKKRKQDSSRSNVRTKKKYEEDKEDDFSTEFALSLPTHTISYVESCLADSSTSDDAIVCVATNGPGTVFLYESGEWAYTSDIPNALKETLDGLVKSIFKPTYVSLGSNNRYYIQFADGTALWDAPKELDDFLRSNKSVIKTVSFGSDDTSYFIVFADGSWQYEGEAIPEGLDSKLNQRELRDDISWVALGLDQEWFLQARNGRIWWGNVTEEVEVLFEEISESNGKKVNFVDFGQYGSYFLSYSI